MAFKKRKAVVKEPVVAIEPESTDVIKSVVIEGINIPDAPIQEEKNA